MKTNLNVTVEVIKTKMGDLNWIETTEDKKHDGWSEFFRYFEATTGNGESTLYNRIAKEGFEYLNNFHGGLEEIKELISRENDKKLS